MDQGSREPAVLELERAHRQVSSSTGVQARALALEPARHLLPDALDRIRGRRYGLSNLISGLPG